jgi:diguanylate cyclase (GGDEF)-like protein
MSIHTPRAEQMQGGALDDVRSTDPVDRLLEDSWQKRKQHATLRELLVELAAAALFLGVAVPLAAPTLAAHRVDAGLAILLVGLYALVSATIRFPVGAGYAVPSYLVLVPMLLLLPPELVPLLTAAGLVAASVGRWAFRRISADYILFSVPNAWHAVGPALVLVLAGKLHGDVETAAIYACAFVAASVVDITVSTLREAAALAVAPRLQLRVAVSVWLIDACIAPLGLLLAQIARHDKVALLAVLPIGGLLMLLERDRSARIAQAQLRLELVGRERTRLQAAVRRLGDAFAAKLDLPALTSIMLRGSIDALDADAGLLTLELPSRPSIVEALGSEGFTTLLHGASRMAQRTQRPQQLERNGVWAMALPFGPSSDALGQQGALAVARHAREFRPDEQELVAGLIERAHSAVFEILAHEALREQVLTDPLTGLGNRRKLAADLTERLANAPVFDPEPLVLMLFDLDGFKAYNDTFGHLAGDAVLARLGGRLAEVVAPRGAAYRLGGDEFCALLPVDPSELHSAVAAAASALQEQGETFSIHASCGAVILPHEATTPDYALQLADERMYRQKQARPLAAREQTRDVLVRIMHAKQPGLQLHSSDVSRMAVAVGRKFAMNAEQIDELARAAELHDIGKVGIPDAILDKPGALDPSEWEFIRQHTVLGERILSAAAAMRPVARIVRASHERWDGRGYPDRLAGEEIPLAARIVAVCDAYDAMTTDRCYRKAETAETAREELLREAGHQFDPEVVRVFLEELDHPQPPATPEVHTSEGAIADELADRLLQVLAEN